MPEPKKLVIAADHGGFALKQFLTQKLSEVKTDFMDLGPSTAARCDYPDQAALVCQAILKGEAAVGILVCGTGQGMAISANKFQGIRAGVCSDPYSARMLREHNNAQILCLGGRVIGEELAWEVVQGFLTGHFAEGRHADRVEKIKELEKKQFK